MHAGAFWVRTLYSDLIRLPEAAGEWLGPAGRPSRGRDCSRWVGSPGGTGLAVTSLPACVRECEEVRNKPTSAAAQWRSTPRRAWHPQRSVAGQEEDIAVLDLAGLVEERREGAGDGGCVGAVLGEGLGRDEDEAGVCLTGGAVLGVEGHEVLDVGGDRGASGCCCAGEYLIVGERDERGVGDDCLCVVAFGAQLLGDGSSEHLIQQYRVAHVRYPASSWRSRRHARSAASSAVLAAVISASISSG